MVYQYTRKKFAKILQNTQNYTQAHFIPEIQRKWYTEYPYLSFNIPYTRFKKAPVYRIPKNPGRPWNTVSMTLSRNQRLLDAACKDHGAIYQLKLRSNHLHRTFELHCTTNFSCKEALNRPRLPFLPLLLFSSYWLIISTRREISYFREDTAFSICWALLWGNVWLWLWVTPGVKTELTDCCIRTDGCKNTISN